MADCNICKYRQFLANAYDMHIDHTDCDKVNTFFCEKMQKPDTAVIIDAGCTDKTMYHKGFKDGYESVNVVHGRWVWTEIGEQDYEMFWNCSNCGERTYFITNYCPNCGANMKGETT